MKTRSMAIVVVSAGVWMCLAATARAQIASYVDEHGKLIFINAEPPPASQAPTRAHRRSVVPLPRTAPAGAALPPERLDSVVRGAAERNKLDPALVRAVIGVESGGNPTAVSRKGALGLMQLIPSTAERFGVGDVFDPVQNVEGGARYLRSLLNRYNGDLEKTLAAYNAGESAVERSGGVPNYPETRAYVQRVTNSYFRPGSGRLSAFGAAPPRPLRRTVDPSGRVIFRNE
jgi:soluble lytic murein transglycosylase-like protein